MSDFLPYGAHSVDDDDIAAVIEALKKPFLTGGPEVGAFETDFAAAVGSLEAVVVNNGTAALHLACLAAGLKEGGVAVVPSVTFLSTANAVRMCGAEVVFADVDPLSGLLTAETLNAAVEDCKGRYGKQPSAILPVHLNGQLVDMTIVADVADAIGAAIIVDACHALGGQDENGRPVGACPHGELTTFSLHPVKTVAMGEGGVITTSEPALADRMRRLRSHDMTRDPSLFQNPRHEDEPWYYEASELGYNYRAPDVLCALGRSQLGKLTRFHTRRAELAAHYDDLLESLKGVTPVGRGVGISGWHLYAVHIDFDAVGKGRSTVMQDLRGAGVGSQVHYIPVHTQPYYEDLYGKQELPGAMSYYSRVLSLPLFPAMADQDVVRVVDALRSVTAAP